mgnify:CR=1 FL=1
MKKEVSIFILLIAVAFLGKGQESAEHNQIDSLLDKSFRYTQINLDTSVELALKAKQISKKNILIAGGLPAQNDTYVLDQRDKKIIEKGIFAEGWVQNEKTHGRPVDILFNHSGGMFVSDDLNGYIYLIKYKY